MIKEPKLVFITVWKLADWGFYGRRNEALLAELSRRDCVDSVLHVEHISLKGLIYRIKQWFTTKDATLRRCYATHVKKGFSLKPVLLKNKGKVYVYSVVEICQGESGLLKKMSDAIIQIQYRAINALFAGPADKKVVFMAYPPFRQLPKSIEMIRHDILIADVVDDDIERTSDLRKKTQAMECFKKVFPKCSLIFSTSPTLNDKYGRYANQQIFFLPNGVRTDFYSCPAADCPSSGRARKVAGYVGAINASMNMELLEYLVSSFPAVDFILIGFCNRQQIADITCLTKQYPNLRYLGERCYVDVPRLVAGFDVLISLKKTDHTTAGVDSMKIYEYLATGKPVVTTPVPPAMRFADIIYVTEEKTEFAGYLKMALSEKGEEKKRERIKASLDHDWSRRVDIILGRVGNLSERAGNEAQ